MCNHRPFIFISYYDPTGRFLSLISKTYFGRIWCVSSDSDSCSTHFSISPYSWLLKVVPKFWKSSWLAGGHCTTNSKEIWSLEQPLQCRWYIIVSVFAIECTFHHVVSFHFLWSAFFTTRLGIISVVQTGTIESWCLCRIPHFQSSVGSGRKLHNHFCLASFVCLGRQTLV